LDRDPHRLLDLEPGPAARRRPRPPSVPAGSCCRNPSCLPRAGFRRVSGPLRPWQPRRPAGRRNTA